MWVASTPQVTSGFCGTVILAELSVVRIRAVSIDENFYKAIYV